ncbi:MAG TPA: hypothetical protein VD928_01955 [Candidatus Paceibacterota bacterium]|nr:hypothetical protein [Candidatus Paceibacterota bacterium]
MESWRIVYRKSEPYDPFHRRLYVDEQSPVHAGEVIVEAESKEAAEKTARSALSSVPSQEVYVQILSVTAISASKSSLSTSNPNAVEAPV